MLADWVSLEVSEVTSLVGDTRTSSIRQKVEPLRTSEALPASSAPVDKFEQQIMQVVIQHPASFSQAQLRRMQAAGLTSAEHRSVLDLVLENFENMHDPSFANLISTNAPEPLLPVIRELALAPLPIKSEADLPRYAQGVVNGAMIKALEREKSDLLAALRRAEANASDEQKSAIQRQLVELEEERRSLMR